MSTFNISKISFVFEKYEFSFVYFEIVYPGNRRGLPTFQTFPPIRELQRYLAQVGLHIENYPATPLGYCNPVPDFYLLLHGHRCRKSNIID